MMMFKFDINTVVEPAVKSAKTFSGMITVEPVKTAVDAVIDANASSVWIAETSSVGIESSIVVNLAFTLA